MRHHNSIIVLCFAFLAVLWKSEAVEIDISWTLEERGMGQLIITPPPSMNTHNKNFTLSVEILHPWEDASEQPCSKDIIGELNICTQLPLHESVMLHPWKSDHDSISLHLTNPLLRHHFLQQRPNNKASSYGIVSRGAVGAKVVARIDDEPSTLHWSAEKIISTSRGEGTFVDVVGVLLGASKDETETGTFVLDVETTATWTCSPKDAHPTETPPMLDFAEGGSEDSDDTCKTVHMLTHECTGCTQRWHVRTASVSPVPQRGPDAFVVTMPFVERATEARIMLRFQFNLPTDFGGEADVVLLSSSYIVQDSTPKDIHSSIEPEKDINSVQSGSVNAIEIDDGAPASTVITIVSDDKPLFTDADGVLYLIKRKQVCIEAEPFDGIGRTKFVSVTLSDINSGKRYTVIGNGALTSDFVRFAKAKLRETKSGLGQMVCFTPEFDTKGFTVESTWKKSTEEDVGFTMHTVRVVKKTGFPAHDDIPFQQQQQQLLVSEQKEEPQSTTAVVEKVQLSDASVELDSTPSSTLYVRHAAREFSETSSSVSPPPPPPPQQQQHNMYCNVDAMIVVSLAMLGFSAFFFAVMCVLILPDSFRRFKTRSD